MEKVQIQFWQIKPKYVWKEVVEYGTIVGYSFI